MLALPPFVWKQLVGERVRWSRDYVSVDEAEVRRFPGKMLKIEAGKHRFKKKKKKKRMSEEEECQT